MAMPDIPDEIFSKIIKLLADDQWWLLRPILKAGKRGRDMVYSTDVLKDANIYTLCTDPSDIAYYRNDVTGVEYHGRYRHFFQRCLDAGNLTAFYYEGLRVVAEERDIPRGLELLSLGVPQDGLATLVCGIFSICAGNEEMAVHYLHLFGQNHHRLGTAQFRSSCEELQREMWYYNRLNNNTFKETFSFPICESIPYPECAIDCAINYGPYDNLCNNCYLWWFARDVCAML